MLRMSVNLSYFATPFVIASNGYVVKTKPTFFIRVRKKRSNMYEVFTTSFLYSLSLCKRRYQLCKEDLLYLE